MLKLLLKLQLHTKVYSAGWDWKGQFQATCIGMTDMTE